MIMRLRNASLSNDDHGSACANDCYLGPERNRQAPTFYLGRKKNKKYLFRSLPSVKSKLVAWKFFSFRFLDGKTKIKTSDEEFTVRRWGNCTKFQNDNTCMTMLWIKSFALLKEIQIYLSRHMTLLCWDLSAWLGPRISLNILKSLKEIINKKIQLKSCWGQVGVRWVTGGKGGPETGRRPRSRHQEPSYPPNFIYPPHILGSFGALGVLST